MREKMWNYFYEIAQQISTRTRRQPNPSSPPISSHLPCLLDKLVNKFGDCMHAEVHLFVLSCQKFNFTTSHATNTSVSLKFGMHFVAVFYISLKSHLLSQYHMLLICSKALKCNEKGIITNKKAIVNQQPTGIQALQHHWKRQYRKSNPFKTSSTIAWQEKMLGLEVLFSHSWAAQCHYRILRWQDNALSTHRGRKGLFLFIFFLNRDRSDMLHWTYLKILI